MFYVFTFKKKQENLSENIMLLIMEIYFFRIFSFILVLFIWFLKKIRKVGSYVSCKAQNIKKKYKNQCLIQETF